MSSPMWDLDPHTGAKHLILEEYLKAWFPILARYQGKVVYFDGFAGPGEYLGGERGSPVIALEVARDHQERGTLGRDKEVLFSFVEKDEARASHLEEVLLRQEWPGNFNISVHKSTFEEVLSGQLDVVDRVGARLAPVFALIDPFGVDGLPFDLIERLLSNPRCEVLITFMSQPIARFVSQWAEILAKLFGRADAAKEIHEATDAELAAVQLYDQALRSSAKFVRYFEMANRSDRSIYRLFFASNHPLGHEKMKEAMWKADESGQFRFSDGIDPGQRILFSAEPDRELAEQLEIEFAGRTLLREQLDQHVEPSPYLKKHTTAALRLLEDGSRIVVSPEKADGQMRRRRTFPEGTVIEFPETGE